MTSWKPTSLSCICNDEVPRLAPLPAAPRKSPITLMSGFKTLAAAGPAPPKVSGAPGGGPCAAASTGTAAAGAAAATVAGACPLRVCTSASSAWMRSSMAFIRLSNSVVSCAGSRAANNAATAGASMNIRIMPRFLKVPFLTHTWPKRRSTAPEPGRQRTRN